MGVLEHKRKGNAVKGDVASGMACRCVEERFGAALRGAGYFRDTIAGGSPPRRTSPWAIFVLSPGGTTFPSLRQEAERYGQRRSIAQVPPNVSVARRRRSRAQRRTRALFPEVRGIIIDGDALRNHHDLSGVFYRIFRARRGAPGSEGGSGVGGGAGFARVYAGPAPDRRRSAVWRWRGDGPEAGAARGGARCAGDSTEIGTGSILISHPCARKKAQGWGTQFRDGWDTRFRSGWGTQTRG